ncbi:transposase [Dyella japonica]|uniref:transposase n=1 Tax=Dyella japonica TaxID=231455 RepID=UPI00118558B8
MDYPILDGEPVVPPCRYQHDHDCTAYKQRQGIKRFFAGLKPWRYIATRYGKLPENVLGFIKLAGIVPWFKCIVRGYRPCQKPGSASHTTPMSSAMGSTLYERSLLSTMRLRPSKGAVVKQPLDAYWMS